MIHTQSLISPTLLTASQSSSSQVQETNGDYLFSPHSVSISCIMFAPMQQPCTITAFLMLVNASFATNAIIEHLYKSTPEYQWLNIV